MNWAMDIFSAGCVIGELFLETPVFNLSQLFNFRKGEYDPAAALLSRIENKDIRELVDHMIQLDPESRFSAGEYLEFWRGRAFPEYFGNFLHQYMALITDPSSGKTALPIDDTNSGESDDRISRIYHDYEKLTYFLDYTHTSRSRADRFLGLYSSIFPLHVDLPNRHLIGRPDKLSSANDGTFLLLTVITSSLRSTARASTRVQACDLLLAFSEYIPDEAKLDRVLPFVVTLLDDRLDVVKMAALRTLAQLISLIATTSPVNAFVFPEYIIPKLTELFQARRNRRQGNLVRITFAQCLAPLAEASSRFLDSIEALKSEGTLPSNESDAEHNTALHAYQDFYESARSDLVRFFESQAKLLLTNPDPGVRRAFLGSIASLCIFLGSSKTNEVILSHLNTYLNDPHWELKCEFFNSIVGVAIYVGPSNLEEFILPLLILALSDSEELVVASAIRSLAVMAALGLFQRPVLWQLVELIARFVIHPNVWIREIAAYFIEASAKFSSIADRRCLLIPLIGIFLRLPLVSFNAANLLDIAKKPLSREIYEMALSWAKSPDHSNFWRHIRNVGKSTKSEERLTTISTKDLDSTAFSKIPKTEGDRKWIVRLRNAGMARDDEVKLLALCELILRSTHDLVPDENTINEESLEKQLRLSDLKTPVNTFQLDIADDFWRGPNLSVSKTDQAQDSRPQTISDALLDASTTIGIDQTAMNRSSISSGKVYQDLDLTGSNERPQDPVSSSSKSSPPSRHVEKQSTDTPNNFVSSSEPPPGSSGHYRNSAINLIQRQNLGNKASPEISTSATNAFGRVDIPSGRQNQNPGKVAPYTRKSSNLVVNPRALAESGYSGRDPHVLRLLESVALTSRSLDLSTFAPEIMPIGKRHSTADKTKDSTWHPAQEIVATFHEHMGPIIRVVVSPDHAFFLTGSEDGSVKVWDTSRLERNVAHRSRQTYKLGPGVKVTALCFVERTHVFACGGNDGSIHLVHVDCTETSQGMVKYNKLRVLRQWFLSNSPRSRAVWLTYTDTEGKNYLLIGTNNCQIIALDIVDMTIAYVLDNPTEHGTPTCFLAGTESHWLLIGTSNGVLDLWDLRFLVRLRSFGFPGMSPIRRIVAPTRRTDDAVTAKDSRQENLLVFVAGGTGEADITAWDLREFRCVEVWRASSSATSYRSHRSLLADADARASDHSFSIDANTRPYKPKDPDTDSQKKSLSPSISPYMIDNRHGSSLNRAHNESVQMSRTGGTNDNSVRAIAIGVRESQGDPSREHSQALNTFPYLIAAGPDTTVRFWDLGKGMVGHSCVVTPSLRKDRDRSPHYEQTASRKGVTLNEEIFPSEMEREKDDNSRRRPESTKDATRGASNKTLITDQKKKRNVEMSGRTSRAESSTSVQERMSEQALLQRHLDAVMDVAILERPYRMIVSVDRSGNILVSS